MAESIPLSSIAPIFMMMVSPTVITVLLRLNRVISGGSSGGMMGGGVVSLQSIRTITISGNTISVAIIFTTVCLPLDNFIIAPSLVLEDADFAPASLSVVII